MADKISIAVAGDQGSFSEEACITYAKKTGIDPELVFAIDMEGTLAKVESGSVKLGILPVMNSWGGLVETAFEAMGRHCFTLVEHFPFDVHQCLMVRSGVVRTGITEIVSHPQALTQCRRYLEAEFPNVPANTWEDTAKAARDLAEGVLPPSAAAIASRRAAELYGLTLVAEGIEDNHPNLTTFIVVKK